MSISFFSKYKHKIVSIKYLKKKVKNKKIVLCHGVFDVVHPGHIRHLAFAKTKADILVVSVTHDKFVSKGVYRPHVPHYLRAANLAAFEMVDYVVIDNHEFSHNIIKDLKPNYFAKGFEYSSKNFKATEEESKIIEKYGGKMIFTPGDVVYSSSKFLESQEPSIKFEKLLVYMKVGKLTFKNLKKNIQDFKKFKLLVVGDTIIDKFTYTNLVGGQTKTPTFSVVKKNEIDFTGGAAIVAKHIKSTGAEVTFATLAGNDLYKNYLIQEMKDNKINLELVIDKSRPTTIKNVIINNGYRLLKIDTLDNSPVNKNELLKFKNIIKKFTGHSVIFSDFRHGIFNKETIGVLAESINNNVFKVADTQVASRWGNIADFKNFDLITPNEKEARFSLADQDSTVNKLTEELYELSGYKNIILKLGPKGIFSVDRTNQKLDKHQGFSLDAFAENIIDPVGSGDALLSYSTLAMLCTSNLLASSIIGSFAAACACEKEGNVTVTPEDVIKKIDFIEKKVKFL
jgi:rfaE bifunctional protein kinase chain/domain